MMRYLYLCFLYCFLLWTNQVTGEDLYELLGVSSSATEKDMKRAYRQLSLKYHPDKQTSETTEIAKEKFVKITTAYRVLSDPERRAKYDSHGIVDDKEFEHFDEMFANSHQGVEDSWTNWFILVLILVCGIVPVVMMQRNKSMKKNMKKKRPSKPVPTTTKKIE